MMGPIILASIVAAAIILERLWTLQSKRVLPTELTDKVWRWVEQRQIQDKHIAALQQNSPLGKILAAGLANRHRDRAIIKESHRGHRPPRRARARPLHRHARHDRVAVAADGPARHGAGHDPHVQRDHDRGHRQSGGARRRHRRGADHDRGGPHRRDPGADRLTGYLRGSVERLVVQMEKEAIKLVQAIESSRASRSRSRRDPRSRRMKLRSRDHEEPELNLISLVDVVLLLLIFFMVSTTFVDESRIKLQLPQASKEPAAGAEARSDRGRRDRLRRISRQRSDADQHQPGDAVGRGVRKWPAKRATCRSRSAPTRAPRISRS